MTPPHCGVREVRVRCGRMVNSPQIDQWWGLSRSDHMKRENLKKKLKAADRRRRNRPSPVPHAPNPSATKQVDTLGLLSESIIEFCDQHDGTNDAIVMSAIRSNLKRSEPRGELSAALSDRFDQLTQRDDVSMKSLRQALTKLQDLGSEHQDPKDRLALIRYLSMLSE